MKTTHKHVYDPFEQLSKKLIFIFFYYNLYSNFVLETFCVIKVGLMSGKCICLMIVFL